MTDIVTSPVAAFTPVAVAAGGSFTPGAAAVLQNNAPQHNQRDVEPGRHHLTRLRDEDRRSDEPCHRLARNGVDATRHGGNGYPRYANPNMTMRGSTEPRGGLRRLRHAGVEHRHGAGKTFTALRRLTSPTSRRPTALPRPGSMTPSRTRLPARCLRR